MRELAQRGHAIHLLADRRDTLGGMTTVERLTTDFPSVFTFGYSPSPKGSRWHSLSLSLRLALDYWRYLDPRYDAAPALRARAARQAPHIAVHLGKWWPLRSRGRLVGLASLTRFLERSVPVSATAEAIISEHRPDVMMLTPLLYFGSQQVDYVRAGQRQGVPSILCVGSWDHLTTKGAVHEVPDLVTVWNDAQRTEAYQFHGIPPARVRVTGAQAYDHWFTMTPRLSREQFLQQVGVPGVGEYLLYLCSSPFITPREVEFVQSWIVGLRRHHDPRLRDIGVLVRPHPQNATQWEGVDFSGAGRVTLWPRHGANPVDTDARADYYHSMVYSLAVVGVNTSAQIESGILGKPVFSIHAPEFSRTQEGTLHFQHLKSVNGGLLSLAATLPEHYQQLQALLDAPAGERTRGREFVEAFVRPHGLAHPAAAFFADAIEEAGRLGHAPRLTPPLRSMILKPLLLPIAFAVERARVRKSPPREVR